MMLIVAAITALVLTFVGLRGGLPERYGGAVVAARYLLDFVYHGLFPKPTYFHVMDPGHAALDILTFAGLLWIALAANRVWPIWASAGALIAIIGHITVLSGKDGLENAYWATTNVPHFVQLIALTLGTMFHRWRLRAIGPYRDWSPRRR